MVTSGSLKGVKMEEKVNDRVSGTPAVGEWKKTLYRCLITAAVAGILAHAFMLFNKIGWHDDFRHTFDVGGTYMSGRWALGLLASLMKSLFGMNVSLPGFNGFLSLFFIALSAWLIILRFRIRRVLDQIFVTAIMICFPVVTATFSYMFTAPYYFFSLLCATAGAYLVTDCLDIFLDGKKAREGTRVLDRVPGILRLAGGLLLLVFSMGIYQAYLVSAICFIFFYLFSRSLDEDTDSRRWILTCLAAAAAAGVGLLLYFVFNKLALRWKGLEMGTYQGLNSMTQFGLTEILSGIRNCYRTFFGIFKRGYQGLFTLGTSRKILLILCALTVLEIVILTVAKVRSILQWIFILSLLALSPLVLQLIVLMTSNSGGGSEVHSLMVYSLVYLFIFPIALMQKLDTLSLRAISPWMRRAVVCCLLFFTVYFTFFANTAYFKAWIYKEQGVQFFNRLIVRVEMEEGYDPSMKVALVGTFDRDSYTHYPELDQIQIMRYTFGAFVANNSPGNNNLQTFFRYYNNFTPTLLTSDKSAAFAELPEVQEMTCYPAEGSIRIIGDTVVVKLSD